MPVENIIKILMFLLYPLLLTAAVACSIILLIYRRVKYAYYVLLLNVLTNPLLNFVMLIYFTYRGYTGYYALLYVLETAVVLIEGLLFGRMAEKKAWEALVISLVLNASSYLFGAWVL